MEFRNESSSLTVETMQAPSAPKKFRLQRKPKEEITVTTTTEIPKEEKSILTSVIEKMQSAKPKPVGRRIQTLDDWARERSKNAKAYTFTPQGDAVGPDGTIIEITPKIPAPADIISSKYKERIERIKAIESDLTDARRNLHQITEQYRSGAATIGQVLAANQSVHVADCRLAVEAKYPRKLYMDGEYIFREIHLNDFYNVRKVPDIVLEEQYTSFPLKLFWTETLKEKIALEEMQDIEEAAALAAEEEKKKKNAKIGAIIANSMAGRV